MYSQNISPERIAYLSAQVEFQEIIEAINREMVIISYSIEESNCFNNCIRHGFIFSITPKTYDIFFNSEYGYRGKYFLGTKEGKDANRELITALKEKLANYANQNPSNKNISTNQNVENSLNKGSAKIWIHQACSTLNEKHFKIIEDVAIKNTYWYKFALKVEEDNKRKKNERHKNYTSRFKAILGLRAPVGVKLEIKGAFLNFEGKEVIGKGKYSRAKQIRYYGFS